MVTTYDMRRLQGLDAPRPFLVTLNPDGPVADGPVRRDLEFAHPIYTADAPAAQARNEELGRGLRTHYCGAYWGHGFHEDGVNSALAVCRRIEAIGAMRASGTTGAAAAMRATAGLGATAP